MGLPPIVRGPGRPFPKGVSGNPGGRSKHIKEVAAAAREHTKEALDVLVKIMKDEEATASARVSAAGEILNRAWGKAPQQIDLRKLDVKAATDDELLAVIFGDDDAEPDAAPNSGNGAAEPPPDPPVAH